MFFWKTTVYNSSIALSKFIQNKFDNITSFLVFDWMIDYMIIELYFLLKGNQISEIVGKLTDNIIIYFIFTCKWKLMIKKL